MVLLSNHPITVRYFDGLDAIFKKLKKGDRHGINIALLHLIQKEKEPAFLLPATLQFISRVVEEKLLDKYSLNHFELWLNQFSDLNFEENRRVRGKIAGKWIARIDYQNLFPIGMGKVYEGTHFVTAHKSPDLDTTVASFWGWLDAFAARVGDGLHVWNLPGGPPPSQIEIEWMFRDLFGAAIFTHLPKTRLVLSVTGKDLMSQQGMERKTFADSIGDIDHDRDRTAMVIVDGAGKYLGDWRATDVESVHQVILLFSSCLRWFENAFQTRLIAFFAKEKEHLTELFALTFQESSPAKAFSKKQKELVERFIVDVLKLKKGLKITFEELLSHFEFAGSKQIISKIKNVTTGKVFHLLEELIGEFHENMALVRARLEKIDIALHAKVKVFHHEPTTVTTRSDVEEILSKMTHYSSLTVVYSDEKGTFPVGVIHSEDLRTPYGTVSLRDFCNREEMGIPNYLEVISVIDHHKSSLSTFTPPMALIGDVQSSNTLVAQKAFEINDAYSSSKSDEIAGYKKGSNLRLFKRLLEKELGAKEKGDYFVHPTREYIEYLHFLYAIIDDTDLLSKVSIQDVECVAALLNRLKSLSLGKEVEIIHFDGLVKDANFAKKAAQRILQNEDMYSLYSRVFQYREKEMNQNIAKGINLFADTKEQNGCCRIGQTKIFNANVPSFEKHAAEIRRAWLEKAESVQDAKPEIDLHIHMISTIVDAEEVYKGNVGKYSHQDELWIWCADNETALEHLRRFLSAFQRSAGLKNNSLSVQVYSEEIGAIFKESFLDIPQTLSAKGPKIAILKYKAGSLNSRKSMVSPFLPTLLKN